MLGSAQQSQQEAQCDWEHLPELHGYPLETPLLAAAGGVPAQGVSVLVGGRGCSGGVGLLKCMALGGPSPQGFCERELPGPRTIFEAACVTS